MKLDIKSLSVSSLQGLMLLFLDKRDEFAIKNEKFCNSIIKEVLTTTSSMAYQIFATYVQAKDPELKTCLCKEHLKVTWEEFLTTMGRYTFKY